MSESEPAPNVDWREHGVKIIRAGQLDTNTPQTPGMNRAAAITHARTRREQTLGGHGGHSCQRQDGRASSRGFGERHLRGDRQGADALGRQP